MNEKTEVRVWQMTELRIDQQADKPPKMVGYSALFNALSEDLGGFREKIQPGAFTRALQAGADVRALFNHDANMVLGRSTSGTLRLAEDPIGLRVEIDLPDTSYARDLMTCMKRGDINQMSFAFQAVRDAWEYDKETDTAIRTLLDCELFDVSAVTYPAYPQTSAMVRSHISQLSQAQSGAEVQANPATGVQPDAQARITMLRRKLNLLEMSIDQIRE